MIGLDTSIVVRLLTGEPAPQAAVARRRLEEGAIAGRPPAVSDLVVGESYFALRHHYGVPHRQAIAALRTLLSDPRIVSTGAARRVLDEVVDETTTPGLMDRLIHGDYDRAGAMLLTFDRDAARLPRVELLRA